MRLRWHRPDQDPEVPMWEVAEAPPAVPTPNRKQPNRKDRQPAPPTPIPSVSAAPVKRTSAPSRPRLAGRSTVRRKGRGATPAPRLATIIFVPGVYLSYPFCAQKCTYCNFASGVFPRETEARYLEALLAEIRGYA